MRQVLLTLILLLPISAFSQSDKDIIRSHDKYRDTDSISARTNDVLAKTAGARSAVAMTPVAVIEKAAPIEYVALVFNPQPVTVAGSLSTVTKIYFQPGAEAILLVKNERVELLPANKPGGISGSGAYRDQTIVAIPVEWFYKLAASDEWTIKIGDVIVGVGDPDLVNAKIAPKWAERVQPRLRAFAEEIRKINASRSSQPVKPVEQSKPSTAPAPSTSEPGKKTCYEGGYKVPCPPL